MKEAGRFFLFQPENQWKYAPFSIAVMKGRS
jgi:hypothetical protein